MREGRAHVRVNKDGWRDRDHAYEKPPGTFRIAVLGDSYAEAVQVDHDSTFWATLETRLNSAASPGARKYEVLNFGVSGYGTAQELLTLRHYVWRYSPDLVLLTVTTGNDLSDNSLALSGKSIRPYFDLQGDELVLDSRFTESDEYRFRQSFCVRGAYALMNCSRVLQLLNQARYAFAAKESPVEPIYSSPASDDWKKAWAVTEALILRMNTEVVERNSTFCVVVLTNGIQVHPDESTRRSYMEKHKLSDLSYPNERIRQFGAAHGVEVLDLMPVFGESAARSKTALHGFGRHIGGGHWNEKGHELAGITIAQWLADRKLIR